jgi:hypothetical protein
MSADFRITKETLNEYLYELGKEFKRINGTKMRAELILVGGASVVANYGFRDITYDVDAYIQSSSAMKQAIRKVGDNHNLPKEWLNTDFTDTTSFTPKLSQFSELYYTFSNILDVRTVKSEYLIAMKLMSARDYKTDLSDVIGILNEQKPPLTIEKVKNAFSDLYGENAVMPEFSSRFIETVISSSDYQQLYDYFRAEEVENRDILVQFDKDYPGVLNKNNISSIIKASKDNKTDTSRDTNVPSNKPLSLSALKQSAAESYKTQQAAKDKDTSSPGRDER